MRKAGWTGLKTRFADKDTLTKEKEVSGALSKGRRGGKGGAMRAGSAVVKSKKESSQLPLKLSGCGRYLARSHPRTMGKERTVTEVEWGLPEEGGG